MNQASMNPFLFCLYFFLLVSLALSFGGISSNPIRSPHDFLVDVSN